MFFGNWDSKMGSRVATLALAGVLASAAYGSTDKASWITEASNTLLTSMPRVDAFMWFNNYKPGMSEPDWRVVPTNPAGPVNPAVITAFNNAWHNSSTTLNRGVFIDGTPPDLTQLNYYESYLGHQDRVGYFTSFASDLPKASVQAVTSRGSRAYVVWQPYDDSVGITARGTTSLLPFINSGQYDNQILEWAVTAKENNLAMDITFGHEMNGDWFNWGFDGGHNGNTAATYEAAFKHVVDIFRKVEKDSSVSGTMDVDFVWTVNANWQDNFSACFPDGIDPYMNEPYVDRMGMNGFNWGLYKPVDPNNPNWDDWREFSNIFNNWGGFSTYATLAAMNNLPIIIGEFGTNTPEPATLGLLLLGGLGFIRSRRR